MDEFPHKVRIVPIFGVFFVGILNNLLNNNQVAGGLRRRGAHVNVVNLALWLNVSPDLVLTSWLMNDNDFFFKFYISTHSSTISASICVFMHLSLLWGTPDMLRPVFVIKIAADALSPIWRQVTSSNHD